MPHQHRRGGYGLIIERYIMREILATFAVVTLLLLLIFLSGTFVRILIETVEGDYPAAALFSLFGLKSLVSLSFLLPLSYYLAVLLALGRLYKDSEMSAMTGCGISPNRVLNGVFKMGLALALVVAALSLYIGPEAEERSHRILDEAAADTGIEGIVPGRFTPMGEGRLLYVESVDEAGRMHGIFVQAREKGVEQVIRAATGFERIDPRTGDRYLVLSDGHRYQGQAGRRDFEISHFKEYGVLLRERSIEHSKRRRNAIPSLSLLASEHPADRAELHWRLALPVSVLLLGLLAVPLSRSTPRQGRFGKLFAGILLYLIYSNMLTAARSSLAKGDAPEWLGLWWVHALMLGLLWWLLSRQRRLPTPNRRREATA